MQEDIKTTILLVLIFFLSACGEKHPDGESCKHTRQDGHYCVGIYMDNSCECMMDDGEK